MNKILKILVIVLFFGFADYGFKYPIFHWIIFYFYANIVIYLTIRTYLYSKKLTRQRLRLLRVCHKISRIQ